jgi:tetratricopeptide (TPR) repeat protein
MPLRRLLVLALSVALASPVFGATPAEVEALLKKRDPQALAQAEALTEAQDGSAAAWVLLTRAQMQAGKFDDATDSAEEAVDRDPNNAQAQFWLGNALGARIGQVNMLRKMAMAPDLRDAFEAAVRLDPNLIDARVALISFYLQAPAAMGGGMDKAKAQVTEISRRNVARGHLAQLNIDRFNKDDAAAEASFRAAMATVRADDPNTRLALGLNLQGLEKWDEAHAFFQKWAAEQPEAGAPHYQIGRLAAVSGKFLDEGLSALERYLSGSVVYAENDPPPTSAWWRLGQIKAKKGLNDAARTAFNTALRLDPKNEEAKKSLQAL